METVTVEAVEREANTTAQVGIKLAVYAKPQDAAPPIQTIRIFSHNFIYAPFVGVLSFLPK
jgi:hypothetical protein